MASLLIPESACAMEVVLPAYVTVVFMDTHRIIDAQCLLINPVHSQSRDDCLVPQMPEKEKQLIQIFFSLKIRPCRVETLEKNL